MRPAVCERPIIGAAGKHCHSLEWALDYRTRRIDSREARVAFECRLPRRREVDDVSGSEIRSSITDLNRRIADDDVLPDHRLTGTCCDEDSVGVAGDIVAVDDIAGGRANDTNAKIVGGI
jgi:hypothetical protein